MLKDIVIDEKVEAIKGFDIFWIDAPANLKDNSEVKIRVGFAGAPKTKGKKAVGSVIISPGRTEYIEKYAEVITELQARGFAVLIIDQRGQGMSTRLLKDSQKGHMDDFDLAAQSLSKAINAFSDKLPMPHILLCHSMGGAIGLEMLLKNYVPTIDCAVFSAPMWGLFAMPGAKQIVNFMCKIGQSEETAATSRKVWRPESFEGNELTHDSRRFARDNALKLADERLQLAGPTNGWVKNAYDIMESFTPERLGALSLPMLVFSAEADTIVDPSSHVRIAGQLGNAKLISVPNSKHEILMETDETRAKFWVGFDEFVANIVSK